MEKITNKSEKQQQKGQRQIHFYIAVAFLLAFILMAATGCASYQFNHRTITTTTGFLETKRIVVVDTCQLSIDSMREVRSGDLSINDQCEVVGGAGAMGASAEAIGLIKEIVGKVP